MIRTLSISLVFLLLSNVAKAEIFVVSHADSPIVSLSKERLRDLYLGRTKALKDGHFVTVLDRGEDSTLRADFYHYLTGMNLRQIDAFWARLVFAGRMLPLENVISEDTLINRLADDQWAIGYTDNYRASGSLKVIYRFEDAVTEGD